MKGLVDTIMQGIHSKILSGNKCLHELNLADLLEREAIPLQSAEARSILRNQVILVTGAAGSISIKGGTLKR